MLDQAKAAVLNAEAALQDAQLKLSYTQVKTPLAGRVGRELVDVGNLVGIGSPTPLTTVVQMDPIYVYFDVSERIVLEFLDRAKSRTRDEIVKPVMEVALANSPAGTFPYKGHVDWIDNTVDQQTGTIRVRGVLDNKNGDLFPGLFVRARMRRDLLQDAVLVREDAIGTDIVGKYVLVIGQDNVIERRTVVTGPQAEGGYRVIREGLAADEPYVVNGIQKAHPVRRPR